MVRGSHSCRAQRSARHAQLALSALLTRLQLGAYCLEDALGFEPGRPHQQEGITLRIRLVTGIPCLSLSCSTDPAPETECITYSPYPAWGWYSKGSCTCAVCANGFARNYYGDCVAVSGGWPGQQGTWQLGHKGWL